LRENILSFRQGNCRRIRWVETNDAADIMQSFHKIWKPK
jgi:hypothetical protein